MPAGYLSAGQRRRLSIARLIAVKRPIWLLDEPASGLDVAAVARLETLIEGHRGGGGAVVVTTHQPLAVSDAVTVAL